MNRLLVLVLVLLAGGAAAQQQQQQQPSTPYYPAPPPTQAPTVQQGTPTTGLSSPLPAGIPKIDRTEIASDAEAQLFADARKISWGRYAKVKGAKYGDVTVTRQGNVWVVKGRIDHKQEGETKLLAMEVSAFEGTPERREVRLRVDGRKAPAGIVRSLAGVVKEFPGETPVIVAIATSQGETTLALGPDYRVKPEPDFFAEVKSLLGEAAVA